MYENPLQPEAMRERYKELPPDITELFEYGTVDFVLDTIANEYNLSDEQEVALRMETELVLYLFFPKTGFVERLAESLEIDQSLAEQITGRVQEDLFALVDAFLQATESQFREEPNTESGTSVSAAPSETTETASPAPFTPTPPTSASVPAAPTGDVKPLRTFAEDVEISRAHSYGAFRSGEGGEGSDSVHRSSQDDILKK